MYLIVISYLVIQLYFVFSNRSNLDPFKLYSEEQIWDALERTHMKECVSQTHTMYSVYRQSCFRLPTLLHSSFSFCQVQVWNLGWLHVALASIVLLFLSFFPWPWIFVIQRFASPVCCSGVSAAFKAGVWGGGKRGEFLGGREAAALCGSSSSETEQGELAHWLIFSMRDGANWD